MVGDEIRRVISVLMDSGSETARMAALHMAVDLAELERRALFGSELARREGYDEGVRSAISGRPSADRQMTTE